MWNVVIIGGGISGLTAAHHLLQSQRHLRVAVVEATPRLGGKIVTVRDDGFVIEGGPDAFIAQKPWALELVRELGLEGRLLGARPEHPTTFVVRRGRLAPMPEGLSFLVPRSWRGLAGSPLLSWPAKLRMVAERWVPPRGGDEHSGDESVGDFVRRRLGSEGP